MSNKKKTVFVSAYVEEDDGRLKFVDADEFNEGWVTQLRVPTPDGDFAPFDIEDEIFATDQPTAMRNARSMAKQDSCQIIEN
tara:strand:- start:2903 stop:3148 length:246 start_codon:yes stop_codon:yes gene_type:complete